MPAAPDPQPRLATRDARDAPPAPPEAELLQRAREGDREAFERLVVRAMPGLMGTAMRLLRQRFAAEEAVADALFKAWRHVGGFRGESGFGTWLHRIVCRVATDRYRALARDRRHREALQARAETAGPRDPAARCAARSEVVRVRAAVEALPARQRLVIVLHVWEGLSLQETAEVLGIRYATAKSNLCHARKTLRATLEDEA